MTQASDCIHCPHAKSDMTPCVLRDGPICFAARDNDQPICVGCERSPARLGVPFPENWAKTIASLKARQRSRYAKRGGT